MRPKNSTSTGINLNPSSESKKESYLSMFDQELSLKMARSGGLGLADMLHANLSERLLDASKDTVSTAPMNPLKVPSASARTDSAVAAPDGRTVAAATAQHQAEMLARKVADRKSVV